MFNQLKKIIASNEMLLKNIIGAFVVKGGSLIISVVLLPLYLRFFGRPNSSRNLVYNSFYIKLGGAL